MTDYGKKYEKYKQKFLNMKNTMSGGANILIIEQAHQSVTVVPEVPEHQIVNEVAENRFNIDINVQQPMSNLIASLENKTQNYIFKLKFNEFEYDYLKEDNPQTHVEEFLTTNNIPYTDNQLQITILSLTNYEKLKFLISFDFTAQVFETEVKKMHELYLTYDNIEDLYNTFIIWHKSLLAKFKNIIPIIKQYNKSILSQKSLDLLQQILNQAR